ncbi:MAG: thiol:disulfide interchange protein DsbA/DsbL [Pseudomonadota bacterium]
MPVRHLCALLLALLLPGMVHAEEFRVEDHYRLISGHRLSARDHITVIEFFSYDCRQCLELSGLLNNWQKQIPPNVTYSRVPFVRQDSRLPFAKIYYTLLALRRFGSLHEEIYRAYSDNEIDFGDEQSISDWMEQHGVDPYSFLQVFNSPGVYQKAVRAKKLAQQLDVRSAPSLVVGSKFVISAELADNDSEVMMLVLDKLIESTRVDTLNQGQKILTPPPSN